MHYSRRTFLASGLAFFPLASAFAQSGHGHHGGLYERLQKDAWEQYAPMPIPRHGLGAVAIGDAMYVAGGGPVVGGGVQSAVHEAFTLG